MFSIYLEVLQCKLSTGTFNGEYEYGEYEKVLKAITWEKILPAATFCSFSLSRYSPTETALYV